MKKIGTFSLVLAMVLFAVSFATAANVTLAWDANVDSAVAGYKLYYGTASRVYGAPIDVHRVTQYALTGIAEGRNVYFAVTAYDANGNESAFSTELECFTVVPTPPVNGTISPATAVVLSRGMSQKFNITGNGSYTVSGVMVDGSAVGALSSYTFANMDRSHTISASFAIVAGENPDIGLVDDTNMLASTWKVLTSGAPVPVVDLNYSGTGEKAIIFSGINDISYATYQFSLSGFGYKLQDFVWKFKILKPYVASAKKKLFCLCSFNQVWIQNNLLQIV